MKRFNLHSTIVRWISAIVVVLCFVVAAPARTWTPEEVPIPRLQDVRRYVSNPEGILSAATVDSLDRQLGALERDRGVQTLVVVVDRLKGNDPYRFAMTLARKYGVGNRETRTGLVVVLATGDRSYQFLTGNGLEGTLPDGLIQQIEDRIFLPRLRRAQWDEAMLAAMSAVDRACRNDGELRVAKSSDDVSTVKGYAKHESTTLENVIAARARATQITLDPANATPEQIEAYQNAQGQLSQALGKLLSVQEQYPELKANEQFSQLQAQLEGTENRINESRQLYNESVKTYNIKVKQFPGSLFAGLFGMSPKTPFRASEAAQTAPSVQF